LLRIAACTTDQQLEAQLGGLLAPILLKFNTEAAPVRSKLMELLGHINKVILLPFGPVPVHGRPS
jgi:hypothetical protein